jgi:hypothetical protein
MGNPDLDSIEEKAFRRNLVERALQALATPIKGQSVL